MKNKKYELLKDDTIKRYGVSKLYRIRALRDFGDVHKGDLGGYVETEDNLSHNGNAWIYHDAKVCGNARVYDNAKIYRNASISCNAEVYGYARVGSNVRVYNNAKIYGDAWVYDDAIVSDNAKVHGNAEVHDKSIVCCDAEVCGDAEIYSTASICETAYINTSDDYIIISNICPEYNILTFYKCKDGEIRVSYDYSELDEFVECIKRKYGDKHAKKCTIAVNLVKVHFNLD